jgi:hypothetical protein
MTGLLFGALLAVAQAAPPATLPMLLLPMDAGAWVVRIETTGGFTGRGLGNFTASSAGELQCLSLALQRTCPERLTPDTQRVLSRLVTAIPVAADVPAPDSRAPNRTVCYDCVTTTMTIRQRDGDAERTVTYRWDETTRSTIPGDVLRLHAAVTALAPARPR